MLYAQTSLALEYELSVTHTPGRSLYVKLESLAIMRNEDKHVSVGGVGFLIQPSACDSSRLHRGFALKSTASAGAVHWS